MFEVDELLIKVQKVNWRINWSHLFARNSVSPDQLKPAMAFFVRLISCEFTLLLIDKGGWIHSHFIMESSDISRSVGYQVTWREAQTIQLKHTKKKNRINSAFRRNCFSHWVWETAAACVSLSLTHTRWVDPINLCYRLHFRRHLTISAINVNLYLFSEIFGTLNECFHL